MITEQLIAASLESKASSDAKLALNVVYLWFRRKLPPWASTEERWIAKTEELAGRKLEGSAAADLRDIVGAALCECCEPTIHLDYALVLSRIFGLTGGRAERALLECETMGWFRVNRPGLYRLN